ncbi:MAG: Intracellular proteinase inhibitor [Gemmatimonadales bacterium]|nr:Intracellular proteinase inhibitor [Gemmatimonadales bacterium]
MLLYALSLLGILLGPMTLHLVMPARVRVGEGVPITLRLTNAGRRAADVYLQGRPAAFDIVVTRRDGTPVWRRLEGAVVPAVLQVRSLAPGAVLEFRDSWPQRTNLGAAVEPGDYLVTGVLPTDPPAELRTRPAPLRILP